MILESITHMNSTEAKAMSKEKHVYWFGEYSVNVACPSCGNHHTAKQRKSDGVWRMPAHNRLRPWNDPSGLRTPVPCENPTLEPVMLRMAYATKLEREIRDNFAQPYGQPRGWVLREALANKHNDTPGLDNGRVLFELFRDVIEFFLSDSLWRAVAAQEAYERSTTVDSTIADAIVKATLAEREACATEVSALLDQVHGEIDTTYPTGRALDELVGARTVLQKAIAMIRARSNSAREAAATTTIEG